MKYFPSGYSSTVKFISFPYEADGYRGRENILIMLAEQNSWLDKYVKNAKVEENKQPKAF